MNLLLRNCSYPWAQYFMPHMTLRLKFNAAFSVDLRKFRKAAFRKKPWSWIHLSFRKTIEKVIYFMLLERKERSPTHEDSAVATIKNLKEICKVFCLAIVQFSSVVSDLRLFWFYCTTSYDWSGKLAPSRPIRGNNKPMATESLFSLSDAALKFPVAPSDKSFLS